jgi:hypothetical protein
MAVLLESYPYERWIRTFGAMKGRRDMADGWVYLERRIEADQVDQVGHCCRACRSVNEYPSWRDESGHATAGA